MDYAYFSQELTSLSNELIKVSERYNQERMKAANCRRTLYVLLAQKQNEARYKSAALDRQLLLLLSDSNQDPDIKLVYEELLLSEESYKGLEKIINAYQTKISALQSLMKWGRDC